MLGLTKNQSSDMVRVSLRARMAGMCHGNRHGVLSNTVCHRGRLHHLQSSGTVHFFAGPFCVSGRERVVVFKDGDNSAL